MHVMHVYVYSLKDHSCIYVRAYIAIRTYVYVRIDTTFFALVATHIANAMVLKLFSFNLLMCIFYYRNI